MTAEELLRDRGHSEHYPLRSWIEPKSARGVFWSPINSPRHELLQQRFSASHGFQFAHVCTSVLVEKARTTGSHRRL